MARMIGTMIVKSQRPHRATAVDITFRLCLLCAIVKEGHMLEDYDAHYDAMDETLSVARSVLTVIAVLAALGLGLAFVLAFWLP